MTEPVPVGSVSPALVVAIALNLVGLVVLTAYAARLADDHDRTRTGTVACRDCGIQNDAAYRFCRACAAELSRTGARTYSRTRTTDSY